MTRHVQSCDEHPKYRAGCRPCIRKKVAYNKRHALLASQGRPLSIAPDLTRQRLQQLRALGYSVNRLAAATGMAPASIWRLSSETSTTWLQLGTFHAVEKVWRELHEFPAVGDGYVQRAARTAAENGWEPPALPAPDPVDENTVDEVAVARALKGERVPLTRAEILEAWQRLEATGMSATAIGDLLHTAPRTVQRWRSGVYKPISKRTA